MSDIQFKIRKATQDDNLAIRKVQVATWLSTYKGMIPDRILEEIQNPNRPMKPFQPGTRAFVATTEENEVIAFAVGGNARVENTNEQSQTPSENAEIWALYVLQKYQGQGIGKSLLNTFKEEIKPHYKGLIIWVLKANTESRKFYEKMGGQLMSQTKKFHWANEPVADEVAYRWSWA